MKMLYFHQEGGGGRTPGTPYAGSATVTHHQVIWCGKSVYRVQCAGNSG